MVGGARVVVTAEHRGRGRGTPFCCSRWGRWQRSGGIEGSGEEVTDKCGPGGDLRDWTPRMQVGISLGQLLF